jgi:hypothetical protein
MTKQRYRVGSKLGRTVYRDDRLIGLMDSEVDAKLIVRLLNNDVAERESMCVCASYEPCAGECCGAGQCSCSLPDAGGVDRDAPQR